jgi:glycosyltransferase involved in cell wall biosynthesis
MSLGRAPRVLALIGDETGCSLWRVWQPFAELEKRGFIAEWCHKEKSDKVLPLVAAGRYDAVITPRIVWPIKKIGETWVNAIHKAGLAWFYECDDDVFSPRIVDRQMRIFPAEAAKGAEQLEWERLERIRMLQICDGVTVSSQRLATIARQYAGSTPVYHIPNSIDARWFKLTLRGIGRIPALEGKLTVGWAGGAREEADLKPLAEAWTIIAERYPHVEFVIQGHMSDSLYHSIPAERRHTLPWLPLQEYPRALINIDIGCCIVAPLVFNTSKTCIKWYEMTLAGVACVVSPTLYGSEVTDGEDALVAETPGQIVDALSRLIESEELRRTISRNARRTVMEHHSLEQNWQNWPIAWSDAIERFRAKPRLILASA